MYFYLNYIMISTYTNRHHLYKPTASIENYIFYTNQHIPYKTTFFTNKNLRLPSKTCLFHRKKNKIFNIHETTLTFPTLIAAFIAEFISPIYTYVFVYVNVRLPPANLHFSSIQTYVVHLPDYICHTTMSSTYTNLHMLPTQTYVNYLLEHTSTFTILRLPTT